VDGLGRTTGVESQEGLADRDSWVKEIVMAKVIEFYIPENARKPRRWAPEQQLGRVIEFRSQAKKSAWPFFALRP
jgi:hypothetical protein